MNCYESMWFPEEGEYERWIKLSGSACRTFLPLVKNKGVAVDVGAFVGCWSRLLADEFEEVLAFEPYPPSFGCLVKNLAERDNVRAFNMALFSETGEMALKRAGTQFHYLAPGNDLLTTTLDDQIEHCDFLKLDVEGAETPVLKGGKRMIERCHPVIVVEDKGHHKRFKEQSPGDYLRSIGYEMAVRKGIDYGFVFKG